MKPKQPDPMSPIEEGTAIIHLSAQDQRLLAETLIDQPEPAPALVRAIESYRRITQKGEGE
jgi:hypothetical protein